MTEKQLMAVKRDLKKRAKRKHLGKARTGAYVYGTLRKIRGNRGKGVPTSLRRLEDSFEYFGVTSKKAQRKLLAKILAKMSSSKRSRIMSLLKSPKSDVAGRGMDMLDNIVYGYLNARIKSNGKPYGMIGERYDKFQQFREYLIDTLIPDLRDSGMTSTADDFDTAVYYLGRGKDKDYPGWKNFILKTLVPDLKESGYKLTAQDFVTAIKFIEKGYSVKRKVESNTSRKKISDVALMKAYKLLNRYRPLKELLNRYDVNELMPSVSAIRKDPSTYAILSKIVSFTDSPYHARKLGVESLQKEVDDYVDETEQFLEANARSDARGMPSVSVSRG